MSKRAEYAELCQLYSDRALKVADARSYCDNETQTLFRCALLLKLLAIQLREAPTETPAGPGGEQLYRRVGRAFVKVEP